MKSSDFQIHSIPKLDRVLARCCELVLKHQREDSDYWGMVGACVIDTDNRKVYGVNHIVNEQGQRDHAEVVAIKRYQEKYGRSPAGSIIVTTLSPCSTDIDQPGGINCTDYINDLDIRKVYCGYKDPDETETENYKHKRFHVMETRNSKLKELCRRFASTFEM